MFSAGLVSWRSKKYLASGVACFYKLRRPPSYVMHHGPVSPEIAAGLLALKSRIEQAKIPPSKIDETINVAGWNIREFGKVRRTEPAIHYIAEIPENFTNCGGALDFFIDEARINELFLGKNYSRHKFTFQMSCHFPIWIQMKTDIGGFRLNQIVQDGKD
jgi:hypothetical protein